MRLVLDENLSRRLCERLRDVYEDVVHVSQMGLGGADDEEVWTAAAAQGACIVSKDDDFHQRSFLRGHPPKVIGIRLGNCSTSDIEQLLRRELARVTEFVADPTSSYLMLP